MQENLQHRWTEICLLAMQQSRESRGFCLELSMDYIRSQIHFPVISDWFTLIACVKKEKKKNNWE